MSGVSTNQARLDRNKPKYSAVKGNDLYKNKPVGVQNRGPINRYGLQSIGKIVSTRRIPPPAQLPSLKSENSGNDPNVFLVPLGGQGWGSKDSANTAGDSGSKPAPAAAAPPPAAAPAAQASGPRTWSGVTAGSAAAPPWRPVRQSTGFQREFPSLAGESEQAVSAPAPAPVVPAGRHPSPPAAAAPSQAAPSGAAAAAAVDGGAPSLRPTTVGSWARGGARRTDVSTASGPAAAPAATPAERLAEATVTAPVMASRPAAPVPARMTTPSFMPAFHDLMPAYMRPAGQPPPQPPQLVQPAKQPTPTGRSHQQQPPPADLSDSERPANQQPIIRDEDLRSFDDLASRHDKGWAAGVNDIDYNKKLSFSDDSEPEPEPTTNPASDRANDRVADGPSDWASEPDRPADRVSERPPDRPADWPFGSRSDRSFDRPPFDRPPFDRGQRPGGGRSDRRRDGPQWSAPAAYNSGGPGGGGWPGGGGRPDPAEARRRAAEEEAARRRQSDEVAAAMERARRRRQEEEVRFERRRQQESGRTGPAGYPPRFPSQQSGQQEDVRTVPAAGRQGLMRDSRYGDDVRLSQRQESRDGRAATPPDRARQQTGMRGGGRSPPADRRRSEEPLQEEEPPEEDTYDYGSSWADQLAVEVSPALAALQCSDRSAADDGSAADRRRPTAPTSTGDKDPAPAALSTTTNAGQEGRDGEPRRQERDGGARRRPGPQPLTRERLEEAERQRQPVPGGMTALRRAEPARSDSERSRTSAGSESSAELHHQQADGQAGGQRWQAPDPGGPVQRAQQQQQRHQQWPERDAGVPQQSPPAAQEAQVAGQLSDDGGSTPERSAYQPGPPAAGPGRRRDGDSDPATGVGRGRPPPTQDDRPRAAFDAPWEDSIPPAETNGEASRRGRGAGRARDGRGRRRGARPGPEGEETIGERWSARHEALPPRFQRRRDAPPPSQEEEVCGESHSGAQHARGDAPEPPPPGGDEYDDERLVYSAAVIHQAMVDGDRAELAEDEGQHAGGLVGELRLDSADGRGETGEMESRRQRRDERPGRRAAEPPGGPRTKPHERSRQSKLPPRLARQRETGWLQRQAAGPPEMGMFGAPTPPAGAGWQPPIAPAPGSARPPVAVSCADPAAPGQMFNVRGLGASFDGFDGASVPARTIIFENTNFKNSRAVPKPARSPPQPAAGEPREVAAPPPPTGKRAPLELPLMFDGGDEARQIHLDFTFDQELSAMSAGRPRPPPGVPMSRGTADLNMKIASVKKVWDTPAAPPPPRVAASEERASSGESADRVDRDDSGLGWEERPPGGLAFPAAAASPAGPDADTAASAPGPSKPHALRSGAARNGARPLSVPGTGAAPSPPEAFAAEPVSGRRPLSQYELYAPLVDPLSHYAYSEQAAAFSVGKLAGKPDQTGAAGYQPAALQFVQYGAPLLGQGVSSHLLGQHLVHGQQPAAAGLYSGPQAAFFQGIPPPEPHLQSLFGSLQSFSGAQQMRSAAAAAPWRTADAAPGAGSRSPSSAGTPSPSPAAGVQPYPPPPGSRGPARPAEASRYQSPIRRPVPVPVGAGPAGPGGRPNPSSAQQQKMREAALHQAQNFFRAGQQQGPPGSPLAGARPPDGVGDVSAAFAAPEDGSGGDRAVRANRYRRDQPRPGPGGPATERRDQQR